jgi:hypothetical protein
MDASVWKMMFVWFGCVILGAAAGFAVGWIIYQMGFELIGSSVALAGAGIGGILVLIAVLKRNDAW